MEMLNWLKEYIKNTPGETITHDWNAIEKMGFEGPKAFAYLNFMSMIYECEGFEHHPTGEIIFQENMTPNFSESFFLVKIAS